MAKRAPATTARVPPQGFLTRCCPTARASYEQYRVNSLEELDECERDFASLSEPHRRLAQEYGPRLERSRACVEENARFYSSVLDWHRGILRGGAPTDDDQKEEEEEDRCCGAKRSKGERVSPMHQTMAENTLLQVAREWSKDGEVERSECFEPLLERAAHAVAGEADSVVRVVVPGAGLCRLAWELAGMSEKCRVLACECSHGMLMPATYLLRSGELRPDRQVRIFPCVHTTANIPSEATMTFHEVMVPDVDPGCRGEERLRVTDQDFVSLCWQQEHKGTADLLVTCFFVDTAFNVLEYIEAAAALLKPGGRWINIGPLHWVHGPRESLRLTLEEIERAIGRVGFVFEERVTLPYRHYCSPPGTLMPMVFDCRLWVARLQ